MNSGSLVELRELLGPWAPAISIAIAFLALLVASRSSRTARKSLKLSQRQEERRHEAFRVHLYEAWSIRPKEGQRLLRCTVTVLNPSDSPNSIVNADLNVSMTSSNGEVIVVKIRCETRVAEVGSNEDRAHLEIPGSLGPREAMTGSISFLLPDSVVGGKRINNYELVLVDSQYRAETVPISVFRDLVDTDSGMDE